MPHPGVWFDSGRLGRGPAEHERGRVWVGCPEEAGWKPAGTKDRRTARRWFDTGRRRTAARLTTNGIGKVRGQRSEECEGTGGEKRKSEGEIPRGTVGMTAEDGAEVVAGG